jgi:hypothetical protein
MKPPASYNKSLEACQLQRDMEATKHARYVWKTVEAWLVCVYVS